MVPLSVAEATGCMGFIDYNESMRAWARSLHESLLTTTTVMLLLGGCSAFEAAPEEQSDETPPPEAPSATATEAEDEARADDEVIVDDDAAPTEPSVVSLSSGDDTPETLPARVAGEPAQRVVVQVKITEGKKRRLHLPVVRLAGDVALESFEEGSSRYHWTPRTTTVLAEGDGVDPEFLAAFEAALAVPQEPTPVPLLTDRWDVVSELAWPSGTDNPHAVEVAAAQRLALSHLALPLPSLTMAEGATWVVHRRIDLFGIAAWQSLECKVDRIEGPQLEISARVRYFGVEGAPISGQPLGLQSVDSLSGEGKLRARYDLKRALPIDMQLLGKLEIRPSEGPSRRFGFELRADEDYLAHPDSRVTLKGQFVQGGLVHGVVAPDTKVWFNKKKVRVSPEGDFLIGFGRNAPPRALLAFSFADGPIERHILHVAERAFEPEAIDGLPPEMVDLDRETRKALGKSKRQVDKVRNRSSEVAYFRDGFRWPMKGKVTSTYGRQRILNGQDKGPHWGVDLAAPVGRKVRAPGGGVVVLAENDVPLSGNLVIIDHGHGLTSSFLHLDRIKVKAGDVVKPGQVFATSGNSGRSTGPHLDWRMNLFDTRIDPQTVVDPI